MKRKFPVAKGSPTPKTKITQIIQTRTPMEAWKMLRAGQPIDQMLGYYVDRGEAEKDVYMMDKLDKLHLLTELKERSKMLKDEIQTKVSDHNANLKQIEDERKSEAASAASETPTQNAAPQQ